MKSITPSKIAHFSLAAAMVFSLFSPTSIAHADSTGITVTAAPSVVDSSSNGGSTGGAPSVSSNSSNGGSSATAPDISSGSSNGGSTGGAPSVSAASSNGGSTTGIPSVADTSGNGGSTGSSNLPAVSAPSSNGGATANTNSNTPSSGSPSNTSAGHGGTSHGGGGGGGSYAAPAVVASSSVTIASSSATCAPYLTGFIGNKFTSSTSEITKLQQFLKTNLNIPLELTGTYDENTVIAVKAFQIKYAGDILTPWGVQTPSGMIYMSSLRKINSLACGINLPVTSNELAATTAFRNGPKPQTQIVAPAAPTTPAASTTPSTVNDELYGSAKTPDATANTASAVSSVPERIYNFFSGIIHIFVK